jgi:benzodiazapine receptor
MLGHLSIGDTWNTINNVDNRLGTAFGGVMVVLGSVLYTTYKYYQTLPLAGMILAPSAVWLSVASFLVYTIWQLNSEKVVFDKVSLFLY